MALSIIDQGRLTRLRAARDDLICGQAVAVMEYAGERTEYSKADLPRLDRAIQELEARARSARRGAVTFQL